MHYRRLASFVLGAWIACSVLMAVVTLHVRNVNNVVQSPPSDLQPLLKTIKVEDARALLRYEGWLKTRSFFIWWGVVQVPLGLLTAWLLLLSTRMTRLGVIAVLAMIVFACFAQLVVGPELAYVGRTLDLGSPKAGGRGRYLIVYLLYLAMEGLKVTIGAALAGYLFFYHTRGPAAADSTSQEKSSATAAGGMPPPPLGRLESRFPSRNSGG